ncbi:hypothetical protein JZ751_010491 [Albula glossodonta]|uniref:Uncharacterized protein n=1 Tax=Albula glossodonta TaxID=121402 RepID=A0A8T2NXD1_9TELE|nr:hypothetical protein JZ751_010491 [Albula glossodonta]
MNKRLWINSPFYFGGRGRQSEMHRVQLNLLKAVLFFVENFRLFQVFGVSGLTRTEVWRIRRGASRRKRQRKRFAFGLTPRIAENTKRIAASNRHNVQTLHLSCLYRSNYLLADKPAPPPPPPRPIIIISANNPLQLTQNTPANSGAYAPASLCSTTSGCLAHMLQRAYAFQTRLRSVPGGFE